MYIYIFTEREREKEIKLRIIEYCNYMSFPLDGCHKCAYRAYQCLPTCRFLQEG